MAQMCGVTGSLRMEDLLKVNYPSSPEDGGIQESVAVKLFQSLFIYEAAFLDGASLMETINQCTFAWEGSWESLQMQQKLVEAASPGKGVVEKAILSYCKSLVLSTSHQCKAILAADIFEGLLCMHKLVIFN